MNEHQQKLWQVMIDLIQGYLNSETEDFYSVVGKLEGALDAAEIKDSSLINRWYDFWTPLETRRALEGKELNKIQAIEELKAMKQFLLTEQKTKGINQR
jgi:hypothetical protein